MSNTANLDLERPDRGDEGWDTSLNSNMTKLDAGYGNNVASIADLPEVYIETGTFNHDVGDVITLPKSVDAINEYNVTVTQTTGAGTDVGMIYVTKGVDDFTVYCTGNNHTDTYSATIYYIGDVASYGGSIYRRWYVSQDAGITDHSDDTEAGSLAWVLDQIGGSPAIVEFPANKTYALTANDVTTGADLYLSFQSGAIVQPAVGKSLIVNSPEHIMASPRQQIIDDANNSTDPLYFTKGGKVYCGWWYDGGTYWTEAIQLPINALGLYSLTGTVSMPNGTLQIDDTITIPYNGILLEGTGGIGNSHIANVENHTGTTIENKSGTADAIVIGLDDTYMGDSILRNFAVDGDSAIATSGNGVVLGTDTATGGVSSVKLENISIHHVNDYGLYLNGNVFENSFYGVQLRFNGEGIALGGVNGVSAQNYFYGCVSAKSTNYGVKDTGTSFANSFTGCYFGENDIGIECSYATSLIGCYVENNDTTGILVTGSAVTIFGGLVSDTPTGVNFLDGGASNSTLVGTYFNNNTVDILIGSGCRNTFIQNPGSDTVTTDEVAITNNDRTTMIIGQNWEIMTVAGAARTRGTTELNSTAGAMAITLANGTFYGQQKRFYFDTDGGDVTLTVASHETTFPEVFYFREAGDFLLLEWSQNRWHTIHNSGVEIT